MDTMFDTLLQLPLFQGLCHEDFTNILDKVKLHFTKHKAGETLVKSGTTCGQLLFLLKGEVSCISVSANETLTVVEQIEAPNVIEPYSLFGGSTSYVSSYIAYQNEAHMVSINKSIVMTELFKYDIFRLNYMNIISNRAQNYYARVWETPPIDLQDKIVRFIQFHSERPTGSKLIKAKMDDFANALGDTRLNVSRALNIFQEQQQLQLHRKEISIPDLSKLVTWNDTRKKIKGV